MALNMKNQSRDSFPSDTKKNLKDCMAITLRSGKELQERKEAEKKQIDAETEKVDQNETDSEKKQCRNEPTNENEQLNIQTKNQMEEAVQKKKKEVRAYQQFHSLKD